MIPIFKVAGSTLPQKVNMGILALACQISPKVLIIPNPRRNMLKRIYYTCKNCGWTTSIPELWADLRPRKCMGVGCKTVFIKDPSALIVKMPEPDPIPQAATDSEQPASIESFKKKKSKES